MTDLLTELMHDKADSLGAPDLDVLAMVREGNRRMRRRRTAVVALGAAAAAVAAFALPTLLADNPGKARDVQPASTSAFATPQPSYAIGSTVHVGTTSYNVDHLVSNLFVSTAGIVFADDTGTVYANDGSASVRLGKTDLATDLIVGDGSRAAWVEHSAGEVPRFVVLDQATGELTSTDYQLGDEGATEFDDDALFAVDGTDVYFRDGRGVVRWDIESGSQTELGRPLGAEIQDVQSGVMAHTLPRDVERPDEIDVFAGAEFGQGGPLALMSSTALNPAGTLLLGSSLDSVPSLVDLATGDINPISAEGHRTPSPYAWLDDDTFAATAIVEGSDQLDLLVCEVDGGCSVLDPDIASAGAPVLYAIGFNGSYG